MEEKALLKAEKRRHKGFSKHGRSDNAFTNLVERTVGAMQGTDQDTSYEDLRKILADIRKQYDEVHTQADRVEQELNEVRHEIFVFDASMEKPEEALPYCSLSRQDLIEQDKEVCEEITATAEQKMVYQHMVSRLTKELNIVQQKIKKMEQHLHRKTHEVEKRQMVSRRVHGKKVQGLHQLEDMEAEVELERAVCSAALDDLDVTLQHRKGEVRHREDFERWRYEVAMDAATEAFQARAGRFRKLYAIEKLTGNCLQKIIFDQAEQSQATEDGFQKIREVTGLTDVMDIVHKFLNRNVENEQLRASVREAEVKLNSLREAEANRQSEAAAMPNDKEEDVDEGAPMGLAAEVAQKEHQLARALQQHEDLTRTLQEETLLFENIEQWSRRMNKSFEAFTSLEPIETAQDTIPYFQLLASAVETFMNHVNAEMPTQKLAKLTSQTTTKEYSEQLKLLNDKEFIRSNCRVPATLDPKEQVGKKQQNQEEDQAQDMEAERHRLKNEARGKVNERESKGKLGDKAQGRAERPNSGRAPAAPPVGHDGGRRPPSAGGAAAGGPQRPKSGGPARPLSSRSPAGSAVQAARAVAAS
eukprot:TRINITY_DN110827_c0_g1_i1.p1 TRINITY_DN110827_c0_g1~~TRINITY_DN110827_c0_g1_i1.p1  ORF type:complete len:587 (+),score=212.27 TRINITY_DN110827_c0_g1_i1:122-1882(+)